MIAGSKYLNFMKNIMKKFPWLCVVVGVMTIQSCNQDGFSFKELTWQQSTSISLVPGEERNFAVGTEDSEIVGWAVGEITIGLDLDFEGEEMPLSEVTFYAQLVVDVDGNQVRYGSDTEKEVAKITDFADLDTLSVTLNADDVYALFASELSDRDGSVILGLSGDLFEITWTVKGTDGTIADSRGTCFDTSCIYGFNTGSKSVVFDWWNGTFDFEYLEASESVIEYSYGDLEIGTTGTIEMTPDVDGTSIIDHSLFGYYYETYVSNLTFDHRSGAVSLSSEESYPASWVISNINGTSMDVYWELDAGYGENAKVRMTRTDGKDWPTHIYTPAGEAPEADVWDGTFNYEWLEASDDVITLGGLLWPARSLYRSDRIHRYYGYREPW